MDVCASQASPGGTRLLEPSPPSHGGHRRRVTVPVRRVSTAAGPRERAASAPWLAGPSLKDHPVVTGRSRSAHPGVAESPDGFVRSVSRAGPGAPGPAARRSGSPRHARFHYCVLRRRVPALGGGRGVQPRVAQLRDARDQRYRQQQLPVHGIHHRQRHPRSQHRLLVPSWPTEGA